MGLGLGLVGLAWLGLGGSMVAGLLFVLAASVTTNGWSHACCENIFLLHDQCLGDPRWEHLVLSEGLLLTEKALLVKVTLAPSSHGT